ncbi:hypothetical protein E1A91_A07G258400v1 [Gossypium mustelinum]|uniref:Uncharacterized protein n=1 Tax=Gossypium mustelinum TaxID=34275 RepID=A0A5D2YRC4_GOSMU|nr:hypothetical protein E1A91_A07G258400v1 [Gossypium mustelinum]
MVLALRLLVVAIEFEKEMLLNESLRDRGISTGCPGTMPLGSTVQVGIEYILQCILHCPPST